MSATSPSPTTVRRALGAVRTAAVAVLLAPVHLWRMTVVLRQPRCRYYPSCSTYAVGALRVHGPLRGSVLAAGRVLRCHPWSPGGIDHVPPARDATRPATSDRTSSEPRPEPLPEPRPEPLGVRHA
jgi:putative membrane protein insertion efficiency factor